MPVLRPEQIRDEPAARIAFHDDAARRLRAALAVIDAADALPRPTTPRRAPAASAARRRQARQATAAYLRRFTRGEPRTIPGGRIHGLGTLIRHGYLVHKGTGYVRTGKRFTV